MAKYVQINSVPNLSTGNVLWRTQENRIAAGDECWAMWGRGRIAENDHEFNFGSKLGFYLDVLQTRLDGKAGFHSKTATRRLLRKLDEIDPGVVHLHNLHGYYVNIEMLFNWLASHHCHVNWTLHDCWAFTGHCAHFTYAKCAQWKGRCAYLGPCPQLDAYPKTISKASPKWNYERKRVLFTMLPAERMTLITPSKWLANLVGESFLAKYPSEVRYNTIDASVFKPTPSDFRERYGLQGKFIVLGVASTWNERKGLWDFARLAEELDEHFVVVMVGLTEKQAKQMPGNIIWLPRTESKRELAKIYTAANVHMQPSVEETFGLTVAEAQACGTQVMVSAGSACEEIARSNMLQVMHSYDEGKRILQNMAGGGLHRTSNRRPRRIRPHYGLSRLGRRFPRRASSANTGCAVVIRRA